MSNIVINQEFLKTIKNYTDNNKVKILFGLPMYGGKCFSGFFKSFINLSLTLVKLNIEFDVNIIENESLIQRARNNIVSNFLNNETFTHLMFLDADLTFEPARIIELLISGLPICGCLYPKKGLDLSKVKSKLNSIEITSDLLKDNPIGFLNGCSDFVVNYEQKINIVNNKFINVRHIGTGFMMIQRKVFIDLIDKYPEKSYTCQTNRQNLYNFFDCIIDPISNRYLSEDYYFCDLVKTVGYTCHVLLDSEISHTGTYHFTGNFIDFFKSKINNNSFNPN
jgi:hypothetical protein